MVAADKPICDQVIAVLVARVCDPSSHAQTKDRSPLDRERCHRPSPTRMRYSGPPHTKHTPVAAASIVIHHGVLVYPTHKLESPPAIRHPRARPNCKPVHTAHTHTKRLIGFEAKMETEKDRFAA